MSNTINFSLYGDDAKKLLDRIGLNKIGDSADVHTTVIIRKVSCNGHNKVSLEFDL